MIITPEHLIMQYFPESIETTRDLYERLELVEFGYSYLAWVRDLENYCLSKYMDDSDYKLLPDSEKNYWISPKAFRVIIETSPSKIGDQIRACVTDIANKVAKDPAFARQLQDQYDDESGINKVIPKVSKSLKSKYNKLGQDAFEFRVQTDTRLYLDIISSYNFQPGQNIKDVIILFKLEVENGVPFHVVDIMLSLTNDHNLTYRTIWCCGQERQRYGAILHNRVIRVNLFEDNKKLVDSYEYMLGLSDINNLQLELEKVIGMLLEVNLDEIDFEQLGEKILNRCNRNDQAYTLAIKQVIPTVSKDLVQDNVAVIEAAFIKVVDQYWEHYVLRSNPANDLADDLDQMVKCRIPGVTLAMVAADMLKYSDLCDRYFKRSYSNRQKDALARNANLGLIYTLSEATEFDPAAPPDQRMNDVCAFITKQLDLMKNVLIETDKWPSI
jgi:hypothetical protein